MIDFENFDHNDESAVYDRVTGPIGARVRIFPIFPISTPGGYVEGTLRLRMAGSDGLLDAVVIEFPRAASADDKPTLTRTIRWAAIESLVVLDENPES